MGEPPYAMAGSIPNCLVLGSASNSMGALAPMVRFARAARPADHQSAMPDGRGNPSAHPSGARCGRCGLNHAATVRQ